MSIPNGTQFVQRFRYRGPRESIKWNAFLLANEYDSANITTSVTTLKEALIMTDLLDDLVEQEQKLAARVNTGRVAR